MAKISGVTKKPRVRKRDGLLEWKVWFTPYAGAGKVWDRVVADTRQDAFHKRQLIMAEYLSKNFTSSEDGKPSDFDLARIKLIDGLKADGVGEKYIQRCSNVYDRAFGEFKRKGTRADGKLYSFRKEHFPSVKSFDDITLKYFTEYINYYCNKINSPQGKPAEISHLKEVARRLRKLEYVSKLLYVDIIEEIETPEKNVREFKNISLTLIDKLLAFIKKRNVYYYRLLTLIRWTGRRIEEVCCYEKIDVDMKGLLPIKINVRADTTKSGKHSEIPLITNGKLNPIGVAVQEAMRGNQTKWLFPNQRGQKCKQNDIRRFLKMWSVRVIGEHVYPHLFCKLYGTATQGSPSKARVALAGRKDAKVMDAHYTNISDEAYAEVLAKLGWRG